MIPRADVEISWDIDYAVLSPPSADDVAYGGLATRGYANSLVLGATWDDAAEWLSHEREVIARIAAEADDAEAFDELAKHEEAEATLWDPDEGPVAAPDLGMFAACLALCAAGCATAASCRGHPGKHAWSREPVILFTADPARARLVEEVARATGCGLASTDDGRLSVYAQSIEEVLAFAALTIERRADFDTLPLPPALAEAHGVRAGMRPSYPARTRCSNPVDPGFPERRFESLSLSEVRARYGAAVVAAPYQPSAHEENDVGFDVLYRIRYGGFVRAIFVQYKASKFMTQRRDRDCFDFHREPYFRFGLLRGTEAPYFGQHNRLVALRELGYSAHYCAPLFFLRDQLERNYGRSDLLEQSFFGDPWAIGTIHDAAEHHVSYGAGGRRWAFHSELRELGRASVWQEVLDGAEPRDIDEAALDNLAETLREAIARASDEGVAGPPPPRSPNRFAADDELATVREVSRLTKDYLGAALLLLPENGEAVPPRGRRRRR